MDQNIKNTLTFAKVLVDSNGANHCGFDSSVYHKALEDYAKEHKRPSETLQQGYSRLGMEDEIGRTLLKAALWAPAPRQAAQDFADRKGPEPIGEAARELRTLAEEMGKAKRISPERAAGRILQDPSMKQLRDRVLAEEKAATANVERQRWPMPAKM
jgi:hypothetical protein